MVKKIVFALSSFVFVTFLVLNLVRFASPYYDLPTNDIFFTTSKYEHVFTLFNIREYLGTFPPFDESLIQMFVAVGNTFNNIVDEIANQDVAQVMLQILSFIGKILLIPILLLVVIFIDTLNVFMWFFNIIWFAFTGAFYDYNVININYAITNWLLSW